MLYAIEKVHDMGYIHRDIKPSNFVMGKDKCKNQVYIVDFGLCKLHLNNRGVPLEQRRNADFRGTVAYASLNAHNKIVRIGFIFRTYREEMTYGVGILLFLIFSMKSWSGVFLRTIKWMRLNSLKPSAWLTLKNTFGRQQQRK